MAGDLQQRTRRQIAENRLRRRHVVDVRDGRAGQDLAAERSQVRRERVGQALRSAAREHPSGDVRHRAEHEGERRRGPRLERHHAVRGDAGEERTRVRAREPPPREALGGLQRHQPEARERERMRRHPRRPEHRHLDVRPRFDDGAEGSAIRGGVFFQVVGRLVERRVHRSRRPVVHRVRQHDWRRDPVEAVLGERQRAKEGRRRRERVNGRADVVDEARQRQLGGPHAAADGRFRFVDDNLSAKLREHDGGGEAVRARTDDDRVGLSHEVSTRVALIDHR